VSDKLKGLIIYLRSCPEESRDEVLEHLKEKKPISGLKLKIL
jgi:hypothetical protein